MNHRIHTQPVTGRPGKLQPLTVLTVALLCAFTASTARSGEGGQGPRFEISDLGTLGGNFSIPTDMNASGDVVGFSGTADGGAVRAFHWSYDRNSGTGSMRDLGTLDGGLNSYAIAINDHGDIVGISDVHRDINNYIQQSFMTARGKPMAPLDIPTFNYVRDINNHGDLLISHSFGHIKQFLHRRNQTRVKLDQMFVMELNNRGDVAGVDLSKTRRHAMVYVDGQEKRLGLENTYKSAVLAISDKGWVGGWRTLPKTATQKPEIRAYLYQIPPPGDKDVTPIVHYFGTETLRTTSVNNAGQCVGDLKNEGAFYFDGAEVWGLSERLLNPGDWRLVQAIAINDAGQIVGTGWNMGEYRAYLLTPKSDGQPQKNLALPPAVLNYEFDTGLGWGHYRSKWIDDRLTVVGGSGICVLDVASGKPVIAPTTMPYEEAYVTGMVDNRGKRMLTLGARDKRLRTYPNNPAC